MAVEPLAVLREAIKQVPAVKYALGVAGVAAAAALIFKFVGYDKAGIVVLSGTFIAMILLYIFANMVNGQHSQIMIPGTILLYSIISFFCIFLAFTVTAFAFVWPKAWADFLGVNYNPGYLVTKEGAFTLQPGETRGMTVDLKHVGFVDAKIEGILPDWTGRDKQKAKWMNDGKGNTPELLITICSAIEGTNCQAGAQRGINGTFRREIPAGPAAVVFFNYRDSPPISFSASVSFSE